MGAADPSLVARRRERLDELGEVLFRQQTGRAIALILMLVGISLIGMITANLASLFIEPAAAPEGTALTPAGQRAILGRSHPKGDGYESRGQSRAYTHLILPPFHSTPSPNKFSRSKFERMASACG